MTPHRLSLICCRCLCVSFLMLVISGCGGSSDNAAPGESLTPPSITQSDALNERYGTVTTRDLSPQVDDDTSRSVVRALNDFSLNLHRAIAAAAPSEGSVESGYSAAVAFSLASAGTGGETFTALTNLLGTALLIEDDVHKALNKLALELQSRSNDDLILHTANRVFVKPGLDLQIPFMDRATADYGAPITEADFAGQPEEVARVVNQWVSDQTDGFIPRIIERFSTTTVFAILNAIFLDAKWRDTYETKGERPFTNLDSTTTNVLSFGGRSNLPRLVREDLTALEIPYGGDELAMLILMPESIETFEESINADSVNTIIGELQTADVEFSAPNWKQGSALNLVDLLVPLGLPANPWNFMRLTEGGGNLQVLARQRAEIEVDETGTRAAAATVVAGIESLGELIAIDRPFVYLLRDRTSGAILFTGRVVAP